MIFFAGLQSDAPARGPGRAWLKAKSSQARPARQNFFFFLIQKFSNFFLVSMNIKQNLQKFSQNSTLMIIYQHFCLISI